jgi:AcrR family transcriptional regulator
MPADTRDRIVNASAELVRRQGYTGTGVKQIVAEAQAPFGSLYHFFPGGKEELGVEVIHVAGDFFQRLFGSIAAQAPDAVAAMRQFFSGAARTLIDTDYADACPIATVALEVASTNEPMRRATADVFESWIDAGTQGLRVAGLSDTRARAITIHMIMALEGAFLLSRATRSTEPLRIAGDALVAELEAALAEARASRARTRPSRNRAKAA